MEPDLQKSFHLGAAGLGAILGAYYYIYAPMQLFVGGFLDHFGSRKVLIPAILLCAAGTFLESSGVGGSAVLLTGRLMQGFGSAFAFVGAMHVAALWFPSSKLALLSGLTTGLGMIGAIIGNAAVAEVTQELGWQFTLRDAGIAGIVVAVAMFLLIPRKAPPPPPGENSASGDIEPIGPFRRMLRSLGSVLRNPQTWLIGFVGACLYLPLSLFGGLWGTPYITAVTGLDTVTASDAVAMIYVGWLIGGPFSGWVSDRIGRRKIMLVGSLGLTALCTLMLSLVPSTGTVTIFAMMLLVGLVSSVQCIAFAAGFEANQRWCGATSIAVINMIVMLVGGLLQPLAGVILDLGASPAAVDSGVYSAEDFRRAMLLMPAMNVLALIAAFFMRETFRQPGEEEELEWVEGGI